MTDPLVPQKSPYAVELAPGDYWWCVCGRSLRQPFCDSSHKASGIVPVKFTVNEAQRVWLCGCKHSEGKPFCDGSHSRL